MAGWLLSPLCIAWLTLMCIALAWAVLSARLRTALVVLLIGVSSTVATYELTSIPLPEDVGLPSPTALFDRNGRLIAELTDVRRYIIDTTLLPDYVRDAVVTAEDRDFFHHHGVSFPALLRAGISNLLSGRIVQGGSTITQQYVKNVILHDSSRTIFRKVKEAVLATKLENRFTKQQILDSYLNTIYFGRGAYGIEAAARAYFDTNAEELTLPQAALLAAIIRAPESLRPDESPEAVRSRRDQLLGEMVAEGYISEERAGRAQAQPLGVTVDEATRSEDLRAAYFVEWLRPILEERFGDCLYTCGLRIHTTLDLGIQREAERAIEKNLPDGPEGSLVALSPKGAVLAFVGGREFRSGVAATGFNYASDPPGRAAGSVLKPFTLLAALEKGMSSTASFSGASPLIVRDESCASEKGSWRLENYGGASYGSMSLASATAHSVNTIYAQVASEIGPEAIAGVLERFGFDRAGTKYERTIEPFCSLALGAMDVTPVEVARSYAALAGGGMLPAVTPVSYVENASGECIYSSDVSISRCDEDDAVRSRAAPSEIVEGVTSVLRTVITDGTGSGAQLSVPSAGKTGTSQANTDAWFAGYTDQIAAAVWVGYPAERQGRLVPQMRSCSRKALCRPVGEADVTGGGIPATIWADFMAGALRYLSGESRIAESTNQVDIGDTGAVRESMPPSEVEPAPSSEVVDPEPAPSPTANDLIVLPTPLPTPG